MGFPADQVRGETHPTTIAVGWVEGSEAHHRRARWLDPAKKRD